MGSILHGLLSWCLLLLLLPHPSSTVEYLELVREAKFADLLGVNGDGGRAKRESPFEGSGCTLLSDTKEIVVVFDSRTDFGVFPAALTPGPQNRLAGGELLNYGFEGVTFDFPGSHTGQNIIYAVQENLHGTIHSNDTHGVLYEFTENFKPRGPPQILEGVHFEGDNRGFEGMAMVHYQGTLADRYLFIICEGNYCLQNEDGGGGMAKVFAQIDHNKTWVLVDTLALPASLPFRDYAAIDVTGSWITVISQEESSLWIGRLAVDESDKFYIIGDGVVYKFPVDEKQEDLYCNVEGIALIMEHTPFTNSSAFPSAPAHTTASGRRSLPVPAFQFFAASDAAKKSQRVECVGKEQSIGVFQVPENSPQLREYLLQVRD